MNLTKRTAIIGCLFLGTSALSFGDIFQTLDTPAWDDTYNSSTDLFGATVQQGGINIQSGVPAGAIAAIKEFAKDTPQSFVLNYDPSTGYASFAIGSASIGVFALEHAPAGGTIDHIGIELGTAADGDSITLSNLALNGGDPDSGSLSSNGIGLFDFAMTPPSDLSNASVKLTGDITMHWSGDAAPGADISAEIIGADHADVVVTPEPGTWALLGSSLLALLYTRRKPRS